MAVWGGWGRGTATAVGVPPPQSGHCHGGRGLNPGRGRGGARVGSVSGSRSGRGGTAAPVGVSVWGSATLRWRGLGSAAVERSRPRMGSGGATLRWRGLGSAAVERSRPRMGSGGATLRWRGLGSAAVERSRPRMGSGGATLRWRGSGGGQQRGGCCAGRRACAESSRAGREGRRRRVRRARRDRAARPGVHRFRPRTRVRCRGVGGTARWYEARALRPRWRQWTGTRVAPGRRGLLRTRPRRRG